MVASHPQTPLQIGHPLNIEAGALLSQGTLQLALIPQPEGTVQLTLIPCPTSQLIPRPTPPLTPEGTPLVKRLV